MDGMGKDGRSLFGKWTGWFDHFCNCSAIPGERISKGLYMGFMLTIC